MARNRRDKLLSEVFSDDVTAKGQRKARLLEPPLPSVHDQVKPAVLEGELSFVDEETGRIYDIPWEKVAVRRLPKVDGFEISDYQVVMRGRKAPSRR